MLLNKKSVPAIDIGRIFCALLVVIIHTWPLETDLDYFIREILTRIAVPFFFVVSAFFLSQTMSTENAELKFRRYIIRIITTYAIWSFIYCAIDMTQLIMDGTADINIVKQTVIYILKFLTVGSWPHLWYFPALIICALIYYIFNKKGHMEIYRFISIPLYIMGLLGCSYYWLGCKIPGLRSILTNYYSYYNPVRRILFMGLPFFILGNIIYTKFEKLIKIPLNKIGMLLGLNCIGYLGEIWLVEYYNISKNIIITTFLYPLVLLVILLCFKIPTYKYRDKLANLRIYSSGIYYAHPLFMIVITTICERYRVVNLSKNPYLLFVFTVVFSVIFVQLVNGTNKPYLKRLIA